MRLQWGSNLFAEFVGTAAEFQPFDTLPPPHEEDSLDDRAANWIRSLARHGLNPEGGRAP